MECVSAKMKVQIWQQKLIWNFLIVYKRKTFTPSFENWVTDYGVEMLGFVVWINLPN